MNNFQTHYNVFILHALTARFRALGALMTGENELRYVSLDFYDSEQT